MQLSQHEINNYELSHANSLAIVSILLTVTTNKFYLHEKIIWNIEIHL